MGNGLSFTGDELQGLPFAPEDFIVRKVHAGNHTCAADCLMRASSSIEVVHPPVACGPAPFAGCEPAPPLFKKGADLVRLHPPYDAPNGGDKGGNGGDNEDGFHEAGNTYAREAGAISGIGKIAMQLWKNRGPHIVREHLPPGGMMNETTATMSPSLSVSPEVRSTTPARELRRLAIIVRDDAYDRLLTPLTFAYEMGCQGVQVDVLFVLWAVKVLSKEGVRACRMSPGHRGDEVWLKERLLRDGEPLEIHDFLQAVVASGAVRLHACKLAAQTFDVSKEDLVPEAAGITDPALFLREVVMQADHCQYF